MLWSSPRTPKSTSSPFRLHCSELLLVDPCHPGMWKVGKGRKVLLHPGMSLAALPRMHFRWVRSSSELGQKSSHSWYSFIVWWWRIGKVNDVWLHANQLVTCTIIIHSRIFHFPPARLGFVRVVSTAWCRQPLSEVQGDSISSVTLGCFVRSVFTFKLPYALSLWAFW